MEKKQYHRYQHKKICVMVMTQSFQTPRWNVEGTEVNGELDFSLTKQNIVGALTEPKRN